MSVSPTLFEPQTLAYNTLIGVFNLTPPSDPKAALEMILEKLVVSEGSIDATEETPYLEEIRAGFLSKEEIARINGEAEHRFQEARSCYVSGLYERAYNLLVDGIDQSHGMANVFLGNMYLTGTFVQVDLERARQHFAAASCARVPVALGMMGEMLLKGMGGPVDEARARANFSIAANAGLKSAAEQLVHMAINEVGGPYNLKKASYHLKRLALRGDLQAVVTLGGLLYNVNRTLATNLWHHAASLGHPDALYYLGRHFYTRPNPDYSHALVLWTAGADANHPACQFCLGSMYDTGLMVERDTHRAISLYHAAAHQGNVDAQFLLGKCYLHGQGVTADMDQARKYIEMAASQADAGAIQLLADLNNPDNVNNEDL
eukprot:gene12918-15173_t